MLMTAASKWPLCMCGETGLADYVLVNRESLSS